MASDQTPPVGSMFSLGWLMAQLFGPLQSRPKSDPAAHLPSLYELDAAESMDVALAELEKLLASLPGLSQADVETACADIKAAWNPDNPDDFKAAVKKLHLKVLQQLVGDHQQLSAYQLGLALSDTCWLPSETINETGGQFFLREFDRRQLALLQTWLAEAGDALPPNSGSTVSQSLQNWQDWADVNAAVIKGRWTSSATSASVTEALRNQASAWHALLSGQTDMGGPISLDAWVRAGQSIARSTGLLVTTILRRFWPVVVIIAAATGGLLYLAIVNSAGTAKVWTSLVTVAAALGVSGVSLRAAALKAATGIEQDISHAADLDARAWSVTWLPTLPQGPVKRYRLAGRGVAAPQVKAGLELSASPANAPRGTGTSSA
jgi:hypothetical protein